MNRREKPEGAKPVKPKNWPYRIAVDGGLIPTPLVSDDGEVRELTREDFQNARPASEVVPGVVAAFRESREKVSNKKDGGQ